MYCFQCKLCTKQDLMKTVVRQSTKEQERVCGRIEDVKHCLEEMSQPSEGQQVNSCIHQGYCCFLEVK